ncbi:MAG: ABC transporter permease, partial [Succinivibrio sp.]|nr:ABC transporter permease [Succinivibrio sp.]
MLKSLCLSLALKFLRSKRYGKLAHFISLSSTLGIAVGVCALVVGLSAMNGFEYELKNRVLSLIPTAQLKASDGYFAHLTEDLELLNSSAAIKAAPALTVEGVFQKERSFSPAAVIGIVPELETKVVELERFMSAPVSCLNQEQSVILGAGIARKLNLNVGDSLDFLTTRQNNSSLGRPQRQELVVAGIFKTGGQIDKTLAFIHLDAAKTL